jgi:membrane-associated protease RseP (regulator of RpoE activity)
MRHDVTRWLRAGSLGLILAMGLVGAAGAQTVPAADDSRGTAWLGVYTQEVTPELRDGMDLHNDDGVLVSRVVPGSPADRAGIRKGDVIVRFGSQTVSSPAELADRVHDMAVDQVVSVEVVRDGSTRTLTARLAARGGDEDEAPTPPVPPTMRGHEAPEPPDADRDDQHIEIHDHDTPAPDADRDEDEDQNGNGAGHRVQHFEFHTPDDGDMPGMTEMMQGMPMGRGRLGVRIETLNPDLGDYFDAPGGHGVLVLEVMKDTPAERAGLRSGDVITRVAGHEVGNASQLIEALGDRQGRVSIEVLRKGQRRTVEATLERGTARTTRIMRLGPGRTGMRDDRGTVLRGSDRDDVRRQIEQLRRQIDELEKRLDRE